MSNIKEYTDICTKQADDSAQRLRNMADMVSTKDQHEDVRVSMARAIKEGATDMQNLVRQMAIQLEAERAECERMERLYAMARKDLQDMKAQVAKAAGNPLNDTMGYDPMFHRKNVGKDGTISF